MSQGDDQRGPRPVQRPRLYEHLAQHIADFIDAQGLVPGDRLPSERQLARDLGVSRATLAQALAALETQGRVEVRHGVGALVRKAPVAEDLPGRIAAHPRSEVAAAREAVMGGVARAAASHPQKAMRIAMLGDDGTVPTFDEVWRCVRRLAGNSLLGELEDMLAVQCPDPEETPMLRSLLDDLAVAVVRGDPEAAAAACTGILSTPAEPGETGEAFTT
ncbi:MULTISPECIES: FadR/GntR family transcriptional regulator [Mumia]|uniref:FadR/GntR family transcriptional regulator n=1 Tax=Mumia TaxID=1546255 RepID=UPI001423D03B|nr:MULTISPECIES: GntR family transcriptional regulator [unclassified Mumia]QMW66201.1 FadR family transcriptional regulator [Mumia sp. ZJ1417]